MHSSPNTRRLNLAPIGVALALWSGSFAAAPPAAAQHFDQIAREFVDGLGFLDASVRPDVANSQTVVFVGDEVGTDDVHIFARARQGLERIDLSSSGYSNVRNVEVGNLGNIAWTSDRLGDGLNYRGVYRTHVAPHFPFPYLRFTIYEGHLGFYDPIKPPAGPHIALTSHGALVYSSLAEGEGGIFKGQIGVGTSLYQAGSPTYFNDSELDVNESGETAAQLEYFDPTRGLSRGLFVWDAPHQPRDDARTAVEKLGVGDQYAPDLNNAGQIAFSVNGSPTMYFYDPPNDPDGEIVAEITLSPGIWLSTPTPFGLPPILARLVGTSTGFSTFGRVLLDDFGRIVFSATKVGGGSGVYAGPDPVADRVIEVGDVVDGRLFSFVSLGKGNDWGQYTLITSDFLSTDREVWRITPEPAPEPTSASLLMVGSVAVAAFARCRDRPRTALRTGQ